MKRRTPHPHASLLHLPVQVGAISAATLAGRRGVVVGLGERTDFVRVALEAREGGGEEGEFWFRGEELEVTT